MKIYLFRHAEKNNHFHPNPGLSERGTEQALLLVEKVNQSELPRPTQLWVSPKKRAHESFMPLAQSLDLTLKVMPELDEKMSGESQQEFRARIDLLLKSLAEQNGVIFICSHSDWIEEALPRIPSSDDLADCSQWSPLQYLGLNYKKDVFEFIEHKRIPL